MTEKKKAAAKAPEQADESLAAVAPLEPPTDDAVEADEAAAGDGAPYDDIDAAQHDAEQSEGTGGTPMVPPQPGADEDGFGGDAPEPAEAPEVEEEAPEVSEPEAPVVPSAATIEPPATVVTTVNGEHLPTPVDAAADRLRYVTEQTFSITDGDGNLPDPESVFQDFGPGTVQCRVKLLEHATATKHARPIVTRLVMPGAIVSERAAGVIKARLAAQLPPTEDEG